MYVIGKKGFIILRKVLKRVWAPVEYVKRWDPTWRTFSWECGSSLHYRRSLFDITMMAVKIHHFL
jgi:hypothetical protein